MHGEPVSLLAEQAEVVVQNMKCEAFGAHFAGSKSGGKYLLRTLRSPCREKLHQTGRRPLYMAGPEA